MLETIAFLDCVVNTVNDKEVFESEKMNYLGDFARCSRILLLACARSDAGESQKRGLFLLVKESRKRIPQLH